MLHEKTSTFTYVASSALVSGGWFEQHLPNPGVVSELATILGIFVSISMCLISWYYKRKNSNIYTQQIAMLKLEELKKMGIPK